MTTALGVRRVRVPFRVPFDTALGSWGARDSLIVELRSEAGARGVGEMPIDGSSRTAELTTHVQALLDGSGNSVPEGVRHAFSAGLGGAVLDLARAPEPLLSDIRRGVGVNDTIGLAGAEETEFFAAQSAILLGFRTVKLKVDAQVDARSLAEVLRVVRDAVGWEVALRLDANGSWDLEGAVARLRAIEPLGIQYVEQPLPVGAHGATARLRARVGVPVAADEAVTSPEAARILVEEGAADVLVLKPARVGGPGAVAAIAIQAAEHGVPVVISSLFETGIGLAAAIAAAAALPDVPGWRAAERDHGLATSGLLEHDLLAAPLILEGGRIRAPFDEASGGLGILVDDDALVRYGVDDA